MRLFSNDVQQEASKGNVLAKQYLEKLRKEEVSIDWAHRVLIKGIRQQRSSYQVQFTYLFNPIA